MALRILVADDNKNLRDRLCNLLETRVGWEVAAVAVNGRDAVRRAAEVQPDIVVIDYSMPELDGISAIAEIHRATPKAEIVVLTVHDAQFTASRAISAGARGYVVKSRIMKDLMPAVEAAQQHKTYISLPEAGATPATGALE